MAGDDERTPIDDLVDLFLYAPVGLLYEYEEIIPKLVRRGKSQVQLARVLGTMAVRGQGSAPANALAEAVASMVVTRINEIGASFGLVPPPTEGSAGSGDAKTSGRTTADGASTPDVASDAPEVEAAAPLPIASYDTLTGAGDHRPARRTRRRPAGQDPGS